MAHTDQQYTRVIDRCRRLFLAKADDYGTSWTILRLPSVTDQLYIKALRIRTLQETGENRVGESQESEFMGIINYCAIALMLWKHRTEEAPLPTPGSSLARAYDKAVESARATMRRKNHDYGEAWRYMRISSITDLILMKIHRLKQIEDNAGQTQVSEGVDANYIDMLNYAVFALILSEEAENVPSHE